ncbi:hypothetical protein [Streptomyces drozdowiczii]
MKRGTRFLYLYAERTGSEDPTPKGEDYYVGKLLTAQPEVADLITQLLGARTSTGRRVNRVEVGQADEGAVLDTVHTLATTSINSPEDPQ